MEPSHSGKQRLARSVACSFLFFGSLAYADSRDTPINSGSELRDWCKAESEASLIGKGIRPANWTASFWSEGNTLIAKGQWRIDASEVNVECRVARGAQRRYASISCSGKS
ncbi:MAG: hypothetical protein U1F35_00865 [Steroidobacteraceae bacterium]